MFTQASHFHTDVFIENLNDCLNQMPALRISIKELESEALQMVLGQCIYEELMENVELDGSVYKLKEDADEKWGWLLNGRVYDTDGENSYPCGCGCDGGNCETKRFDGIIHKYILSEGETPEDEESFERNYLAYFIYYHWKTINETVTAGAGEQSPQVKNSVTFYNKKKRYRAWNAFVQWVHLCGNPKVGLYRFLKDHKEEFPNWDGMCLKSLNIWDI